MAETKPTVGVLQTFVGVVADAAEWLVGLLGDDAARRAVFSDLGMEPKEGIEVDSEDLLRADVGRPHLGAQLRRGERRSGRRRGAGVDDRGDRQHRRDPRRSGRDSSAPTPRADARPSRR